MSCLPSFYTLLCFSLVILLLKMASKCSAKVLFESRKSVVCLPEKIHTLDKLHSGMSYSAGGCGFNMNAAAAAKLLQLCPTLCDPIDGSPPGSSVHGIFKARVLEWLANAFYLLLISIWLSGVKAQPTLSGP